VTKNKAKQSQFVGFWLAVLTVPASLYEYAKNWKANNNDNKTKNNIDKYCVKTNEYSCENESSGSGGIQKMFRGNVPAGFGFFEQEGDITHD